MQFAPTFFLFSIDKHVYTYYNIIVRRTTNER
nr:MAG TPA: hypothetical protein [Caudoviricetes sp.]DAT22957.1 MAG TPA: hypothetical protein [Caudoviricetes sp.]